MASFHPILEEVPWVKLLIYPVKIERTSVSAPQRSRPFESLGGEIYRLFDDFDGVVILSLFGRYFFL